MESIFCLLLVVEVFSLQKVVEMLEEMEIGWREVRYLNLADEAKLQSPLCSTFEALVKMADTSRKIHLTEQNSCQPFSYKSIVLTLSQTAQVITQRSLKNKLQKEHFCLWETCSRRSFASCAFAMGHVTVGPCIHTPQMQLPND